MHEQLVQALEEKVLRLIGEYAQLQKDHAALLVRVAKLEERQQMAIARIDGLLQKVEGS
jgi:hypothetical protein